MRYAAVRVTLAVLRERVKGLSIAFAACRSAIMAKASSRGSGRQPAIFKMAAARTAFFLYALLTRDCCSASGHASRVQGPAAAVVSKHPR